MPFWNYMELNTHNITCHSHNPRSSRFHYTINTVIVTSLFLSCKRKGINCETPYLFPLTLSLKTPEHLKVTTLLASSIRFSLVWGFLPLRFLLPFMQNFPKPVISISSPFSRVFFKIAKRESTSWVERSLVKWRRSWIVLAMWALVRVMADLLFSL